MQIDLGDVTLWFDVSGPSVLPLGDTAVERPALDPWSVLAAIRCPVLILAGEDDPICPLPIVEDLAEQLPAGTTRLVRLPGARHNIFRDRPDLAFPAIEEFIGHIKDSERAD
jgi:proline iminopeptidase